jgi:hypothetical protein
MNTKQKKEYGTWWVNGMNREPRHLSKGGNLGGRKATKRAKTFAAIKAKPLDWGSK